MELTAGLARLTIISDISKRERTNASAVTFPMHGTESTGRFCP